VLKAIADPALLEVCRPVVVGSASVLRNAPGNNGPDSAGSTLSSKEVPSGSESSPSLPRFLDTGLDPTGIEPGIASAASGLHAIAAIERAVELCLNGRLDAVATAPVSKEALKLAGSAFPGHTEMLADLCRSHQASVQASVQAPVQAIMCFFAGDLRVFLLTIHTSLRNAIEQITRERVIDSVKLVDRELRRYGTANPRIAMAGLNPHAGEHGLFGLEEEQEIAPAIEECRRCGIDVSGPFPGDTIFLRAWRGEFDAVGACYHDQGLIAVKCLAFGSAVNVTLGLPIIRTSVDHGTAFDIAGRGIADHRSMVEAIKLAARLASLRDAKTPKEKAN
jgi:4-hydroxythreonine-4-phosphate dehydrogenase